MYESTIEKRRHGDLTVRWMLSFHIIDGKTEEPYHPIWWEIGFLRRDILVLHFFSEGTSWNGGTQATEPTSGWFEHWPDEWLSLKIVFLYAHELKSINLYLSANQARKKIRGAQYSWTREASTLKKYSGCMGYSRVSLNTENTTILPMFFCQRRGLTMVCYILIIWGNWHDLSIFPSVDLHQKALAATKSLCFI